MTDREANSPHPSREAAWAASSLLLTFAAAPLVGVFVPLGMAPLLVATGCLAAIALWRARLLPIWNAPAILALAAIYLWALLSTSWAIDPRQAAFGSAKLALSGVLGAVLATAAARFRPRLLPMALILGGGLAVLVLGIEYVSQHILTDWITLLRHGEPTFGKSSLNRGASVLAVFCWPLVGLLWTDLSRKAAIAMALGVFTVVLISDNSTAKMAISASVLGALGIFALPRVFPRVLAVMFGAYIVLIPVLAGQLPPPQQSFEQWDRLPFSMHHRLTIWQFTADRIGERPGLGWGFDAARSIPGGETTVIVQRPKDNLTGVEQMMPLHPHNAVLQVWMELGVVGAALVTALLWLLTRRGATLPARSIASLTAFATLCSAFVVANVSFGFWQSWWQATMWIAASGCVAVASRAERNP